jgi:two-component system sensor histidine kinase BaeS
VTQPSPTVTRGQPLSLRLAIVLSAAVVAVLLVTGLAVNRLVSGPLQDELSAAQRDRLTVVAAGLGEVDWTRPRGLLAVQVVLRRVAEAAHGTASLFDADGHPIAVAGQLPPGVQTDRFTQPIPRSDATVAVDVPRPDRSFLRLFNLTFIGAGILAVVALVIASLLLSDRLTRPLRGVAAAAQRLGAGDLSARASGGPDRESAELAGAFNAMAERLERSEMLRRRAASDMAHDLATPATVLESQLQAMADGVVPADREQLDRARAAAGALSGVIVQLRDLVDAESSVLQRQPARAAMSELIGEARQAMEPFFRERGVVLAVDPVAADLAVNADPTQVGRALRNVLANAGQHSPAGGTVRVAVERAAGEVLTRVSDAGPGIAEDDLPHVFERFYRADQARGAAEPRSGSGIGLTIARELLAANGGRIAIEKTGPEGTTLLIGLPAV